MIRMNMRFQRFFFAAAAITASLLALSKLSTQRGVVAPANSDANTSLVAFTTTHPGPHPDSAAVVINGDLTLIDWKSLVGKRVRVTGDLVIVDTHDLARRGQVKVARERLYVPTTQIDPNDSDPEGTSFEGGSNVAEVVGAQKFNDRAMIILDDGSPRQNVFPPALFPDLGKAYPTVRVGSVIKGVTGKLVKAGNALLLVADKPLQWMPAERPPRPDVGEADLTVASLNVLNYFTTIDDGSNNARGADSDSELDRQEAKLVAAVIGLEADVIGLMEIENNLEAEIRLVAALNKKMGKEFYKGCGIPERFNKSPGGQDAIRVGIIYRADRVATIGAVERIDDDAFYKARTPIVQRFKSKKGVKPFTFIVNHFKSKGGANRADAANKNKGDGQGAYNATRRGQALAIARYVDELRRKEPSPRVLVVGDLNAYEQEDPIDALRAKGLVDLHERFEEETSPRARAASYSFVYRGQSGSLDHALATDELSKHITGVATWHINADEPRFLDYNQEYNPKTLYEVNPFRSSDHDPVLIGIGK